MTSQGRVKELSLWGLGDFAIRGGGAAFGAVFGAQQAAAGFSLATLLVATPILVWITVRHGPFRFRDYFSSGYPGILIGLTTLVAVLLSKMIADSGSIGSLVLALSFSGTAWLVTMFALAPTRDLLLRPNPKGKNVGALQK
jgi:PST family polysaccharide transporter